MRRLRSSDSMRRLVRETALSVNDLVYPLFVREGEGVKEPIRSMTDCFHFSPDTVASEATEVAAVGTGLGTPAEQEATPEPAPSESAGITR